MSLVVLMNLHVKTVDAFHHRGSVTRKMIVAMVQMKVIHVKRKLVLIINSHVLVDLSVFLKLGFVMVIMTVLIKQMNKIVHLLLVYPTNFNVLTANSVSLNLTIVTE